MEEKQPFQPGVYKILSIGDEFIKSFGEILEASDQAEMETLRSFNLSKGKSLIGVKAKQTKLELLFLPTDILKQHLTHTETFCQSRKQLDEFLRTIRQDNHIIQYSLLKEVPKK